MENTPTAGQAPDLVTEFARSYTYDRAGRLVQVDDRTALLGESLDDDTADGSATPCVTRSYDFDVRGNRLARDTTVSGANGVCGTGSSFTDAWAYDGADRVQTGANVIAAYVYDALGRQTLVPAVDSPMGAAAGDLSIGYFDNDLVRSLTQNGTTTTFAVDALGRRTDAVSTSASGAVTVSRHYGDATDKPAWVTRNDALGSSVSWYGSSLGGDLGVLVADGVVTIQIADLHGDAATALTLDGAGAVVSVGAFADFDEYGRVLTVQPETGAVTYGWLGAKERATDEATGLLLMGVRLYNPVTGLFTSVDPVPGGNTTAYAYPQDPVNMFDFDGRDKGKSPSKDEEAAYNKHRKGLPLTPAEKKAYKSYMKKVTHNEKVVDRTRNAQKRASVYSRSRSRSGVARGTGSTIEGTRNYWRPPVNPRYGLGAGAGFPGLEGGGILHIY